MRLLFLSHVPDNPDAGASRVYHLLANAMRGRGHDVDLIHLDDVAIPRTRSVNLLARRVALPQLLSRAALKLDLSSYEAIMSSSGTGAPLYRAVGRRANRPLLVNHVHGFTIFDHLANMTEARLGNWPVTTAYRAVSGPIQIAWDRAGTTVADVTVVQNLRDLSYAARDLGSCRSVELIEPALHPDILVAGSTPNMSAARQKGALLWFGTWEARKGAALLPQALRIARSVRPELTLTLGGTGVKAPNELIMKFAREDRPSVTVLPRVSRSDQADLFQKSSIFLFPSLSEGFGLALLEAMSGGLPAVTTSTGFGGDHLRDGYTAMICPPSAEHVARAVVNLVDDDELRLSIGERGRAIAHTFTSERMAERYEAVFAGGIHRQRVLRAVAAEVEEQGAGRAD